MATYCSLQCIVDWILAIHLPTHTRPLAHALNKALRRIYNAFLNAMNNAAPQMIVEKTWPSMSSILGNRMENDDKSVHSWAFFHASESALAREHLSEITRMKTLKATADTRRGPQNTPLESIFDTEPNRFGICVVKLHKSLFDALNATRSMVMRRQALQISQDDQRRTKFIWSRECKCTKQLLLAMLTKGSKFLQLTLEVCCTEHVRPQATQLCPNQRPPPPA